VGADAVGGKGGGPRVNGHLGSKEGGTK
jgi:hypothetical protein